jgi:hypothetical protein
MGYQEELFKYTNEATKSEILLDEYGLFKNNLLNNILVYLLQITGITLSLNIGLIFQGYKVNFHQILKIVLKSSIVLVLVYLAVPTILYFSENVYSFYDLYKIESNSTLVVFAKESTNTGVKNLLEAFSLTQIVFVGFLALGIKHLMVWTYKKALLKTAKIYGLAFILWLCFSLTIDLNFNL